MSNYKKQYAEKLRSPKWQRVRLKVMERDDFACQLCGDKDTTLNVHHLKYSGANPWEAPIENLVTYCKNCHAIVEALKKCCPQESIVRIKLYNAFFPYLYLVHTNTDKVSIYTLDEDGQLDFPSKFKGKTIRDMGEYFKLNFTIIPIVALA